MSFTCQWILSKCQCWRGLFLNGNPVVKKEAGFLLVFYYIILKIWLAKCFAKLLLNIWNCWTIILGALIYNLTFSAIRATLYISGLVREISNWRNSTPLCALSPERWNETINYFISSSKNRSHKHRVYDQTLFHCITMLSMNK